MGNNLKKRLRAQITTTHNAKIIADRIMAQREYYCLARFTANQDQIIFTADLTLTRHLASQLTPIQIASWETSTLTNCPQTLLSKIDHTPKSALAKAWLGQQPKRRPKQTRQLTHGDTLSLMDPLQLEDGHTETQFTATKPHNSSRLPSNQRRTTSFTG